MLGDENNNELFDLANFDAKKTALLVIDELGDPTGTPLEQTLLPAIENTARIAAAARRAGVPVIFTNDAHIPGLDGTTPPARRARRRHAHLHGNGH